MTELTETQKKLVDSLYYSPQERAQGVYAILTTHLENLKKRGMKDVPTPFDILCFAIEYQGMMVASMQDEEFTMLSQHIIRWLRTYHYNAPQRIYGEPDKREAATSGETQRSNDSRNDGS